MNYKLTFLLTLLLGLTACYKDTGTGKCARQRKFDFKDECKNVDQMEPIPGLSTGIRRYSGVERFSPCYNPNNSNEVAFFVVTHNFGTEAYVVIANLQTGEHRLVIKSKWNDAGYPIEWGRKDILFFRGLKQWVMYDIHTKDSVAFNHPYAMYSPRWNVEGDKLVSWFSQVFRDEAKEYLKGYEMASLSWPNLEIERAEYFRSGQLPHHGDLAISPNGDYFYLQVTDKSEDFSVSKWISNDFLDSGILYSSQPSIGYLGDDYEWHPNEKEVFFANVDDGIFSIEKGGSKQCRIKKGCPNRHYEQITISPLGDKLIAQRRDIKDDGRGGYVSENTKPVIMDINGCNEEVLFEDWDGEILE